jgi:pimeloyl-ACP methyl ester carboxylesterase
MLDFSDQGAGAPVVLLHGFGLDGRSWTPQIAAFAASHRVIVVDLPGFGPGGQRLTGAHGPAAEVRLVLDALGVDRAHLVGHSFGAAVAVDLALSSPERVSSLTLVNGLLLGKPTGLASWPSCVARAKIGDLDGARRAWFDDALFAPARENAGVGRALEAMVADYGCGQWAGRITHRWFADDHATHLSAIHAPALVVDADRELAAFKDMAAEYARLLPDARRLTIPAVGHCSSLETPSVFNDAALRFLAAIDGRTRGSC